MKAENDDGIILIVDDDPTNVHVLVDVLSNEGFQVSVAMSGDEALVQVERVNPDIILLDIIMPGIDGFETCRRLKANPATSDIPVIFMTALADTANTVTGFEVGGVDYITKPVQHEEVLARMNTQLTIRKQQRRIQRQNAQLKELNASKDKFFSIISHDLRNPFSGFLSCIHLLEEGVDAWEPDQITEITALLRTSAEHLSALLENLLTWSRVQQGLIDYHVERCDLHLFAVRNIKLFTPNADHKQISLTHSIPEQTCVSADLNMVDTIMRNLLSNALKFTSSGGTVHLSARRNQQHVEVSVSDTGIGIAAQHLSKLFRIDAKYKRPGTAQEKGTGLGLILCREFVEHHGGRMWVESDVKKGSTFKFTLPHESPTEHTEKHGKKR